MSLYPTTLMHVLQVSRISLAWPRSRPSPCKSFRRWELRGDWLLRVARKALKSRSTRARSKRSCWSTSPRRITKPWVPRHSFVRLWKRCALFRCVVIYWEIMLGVLGFVTVDSVFFFLRPTHWALKKNHLLNNSVIYIFVEYRLTALQKSIADLEQLVKHANKNSTAPHLDQVVA